MRPNSQSPQTRQSDGNTLAVAFIRQEGAFRAVASELAPSCTQPMTEMIWTLPGELTMGNEDAAIELVNGYYAENDGRVSYSGARFDVLDGGGDREEARDHFTHADLLSTGLLSTPLERHSVLTMLGEHQPHPTARAQSGYSTSSCGCTGRCAPTRHKAGAPGAPVRRKAGRRRNEPGVKHRSRGPPAPQSAATPGSPCPSSP